MKYILLIGGGMTQERLMTDCSRNRCQKALEIFQTHQDVASIIICTDERIGNTELCDLMVDYLTGRLVPIRNAVTLGDLITLPTSSTPAQQVAKAQELLRNMGLSPSNLIIVGDERLAA